MNNPMEENISMDERLKKQSRGSQPSSRKSRSISRFLLGNKRSSIDITSQDIDISRCLTSIGIFDACDLWANVTLFRDYTTCRRLFIITDKNQLFIGKSHQKQSSFKVKHHIDLNRVWLYSNLNDSTASEITSLTYYDHQRTLIIGWPLAENFLVEFDTKEMRNVWYERIQGTLSFWWHMNGTTIEHVRIVIDQNQESDRNNNTTSFVIRKVISIRPQDTVRDLIKKCIDTSYLRDPVVDNYVLYVINDCHLTSNPTQASNATSQLNTPQLIPLIGHEYPYAIKMKHLKPSTNSSFDTDDHLSVQSSSTPYSHHSSSTSLNHISSKSHDFELRKRETDHQTKKHRFFPKRKPKENHPKPSPQSQSHDDHHSTALIRTKSSQHFFGQTLDELINKSNHQLPVVIQQLMEILYYKGPETTGIFRKVANTRSVKESIEKIERNIPLQEDDLHPILAAGIFKHFLRTLPEPVFDTIQYDNWKKCLRLPIIQERITFARRSIISTLSESNHLLLKGFICILHRISQDADTNGMNPFNLGLCVSNSLFKTESTTITSGKQEADVMSSIVEFLILNSSSLFGADVLTCIPDKHIMVHQIPNMTRPTASSIESLDEVESSPHLPVVNRSRDSGLATSDQPFNDDSSEISEHFRRQTSPSPPPEWLSSVACGTGTVLTSIILPPTTRRNLKNPYKPSKQFLEREKLTNDTTDDSEHEALLGDSSVRSSTTTVHNMTIGKIKRTKPISRHSSLGSNEHHQQQQQNSTKESKRLAANDVKRASSMKQFHHASDEGDNDEDEQNKTLNANNNNNNTSTAAITKKKISKNAEPIASLTVIERRAKLVRSKNKHSDEESMMTRSVQLEQQDLDLTSEPLSAINQRLMNSSTTRSASFTTNAKVKKLDSPFLIPSCLSTDHPPRPPPPSSTQQQPPVIHLDGRSRHNGPLTATTNQIYNSSCIEHSNQIKSLTQNPTERDRTFVHHSDSRPFKLGTAIQMKPIDDQLVSSNGRRRPCHRQNALRYKSIDQDHQERRSTPIIVNQNRIYSSNENSSINITRHQSIERRIPPTSPNKSFSFDINNELLPSDISWSVREKAKLFEHTQPKKFSTGRENYV